MDYIHTLLIAEDDLDDNTEVLDDFDDQPAETEDTSGASHHQGEDSTENLEAAPSWCVCVQTVGQCLKTLRTNAANKKSA